MAVLLLADHDNENLNDQTAKSVTAAQAMGGDIHILCAGDGCKGVSEQAAKLDGVAKVLCASDASYGNGLAEPLADLIVSLAGDYEHLVAGATTTGKNVMPRVAALLDTNMISDISAVEAADTFERPIYAGNAMATVKSADPKKVITVRGASFDATGEGGSAAVEEIAAAGNPGLSEWVEDKVVSSDRPELTSAKIVISGGRGMGSKENFEIIDKVADKLGAAVGASRAAVDSGYAPNDYQVGQTGKVVADSKVIVAINKDEEAPIFQVADYGLVADLFDAVPKLEAAL